MDNSVDAWVVLGTKLDSKQFEKDLKKEVNELNKLVEQGEKLNERKIKLKVEIDKDYKKEIAAINEQRDKEIQGWANSFYGGDMSRISDETISRISDKYKPQIDEVNAKYDEQREKLKEINKQIEENAAAQELVKDKIEETSEALQNQRGVEKAKENAEEIKQNADNIFKKITQVGLAVFGVRGAFTLVRQAMSSILSNNKKLKDQYDGMRQSLYAAFTPVIEKIINLMRTLMAYANYIWKRLFGKDLFKNSVKSSSKTAKNAKEINKQLAAFDEADVLSDNKSGGDSGGGTTNLGLDKIKIPTWLEKIMDWVEKYPTLSKILFGLAAFTLFGGWKIAAGLLPGLAPILTTLGSILSTAALIAATVIICKVVYDKVVEALNAYKELRAEQKQANSDSQETAENNIKLDETWVNEAKSVGKTTKEIQTYTSHIKNTIKINRDKINSQTQDEASLKKLKAENEKLIATYQWLYDQGMLTEDQEKQYYEFLRNEMANGLDITNEKLGITADSFNSLDKKYKTQYEVEVKTKGKEALESLAGLLKNSTIQKWLGVKFMDTIKSFNADGGIVNMPGRGVPVPYAGERGREGIIPMDNQQQMEVLGQAIAKYVNINNVVNNYMDARKINSILQKSASKERLANNG